MADDPRSPDDHSCPLCAGTLEWHDVSLCMECGGDPRELRMLDDEAHCYHEVLLLGRFPIVLCDFCQIDFGTYPSYFFGLPRHKHLGFNDLVQVRKLPAERSKDWVCLGCGYRLAFTQFVMALRAQKPLDA